MDILQFTGKFLLILINVCTALSFKFFAEDEFSGIPIRIETMLREQELVDVNNSKRDEIPICQFTNEDNRFTISENSICSIDSFIKAKSSNNDPLGTITNVLNGENFYVEFYTIDNALKMIFIEAISGGSFQLFQMLSVGSLDFPSLLTLSFAQDEVMTLENIDIHLVGRSVLEYDKFIYETTITVLKKTGQSIFIVDNIEFGNVTTADLNHILAKVGLPGVLGSTYGLKQDAINTIVTDLSATGVFNTNDEYQLIFQTNEAMMDADKLMRLNTSFVISKFNTQVKPSLVVMINYPANLEVDNEINFLLSTEYVTKIPMTKAENHADDNWCVVIADQCTRVMKIIETSDTIKTCFPDGNANIKRGFHVNIRVKIKKALQRCGVDDNNELKMLPDIITLNGKLNAEGSIQFSLSGNFDTPFKATITCLSDIPKNTTEGSKSFDFSSVPVPSFLKGEDGKVSLFKLGDFSMNYKTKTLKFWFIMNLPERYNTIPFTDISFPKISFSVEKTKENIWIINGSAHIKVDSIEFDVSIAKENDTYTLQISCDSVRISQVVSLFKDLQKDSGRFEGTSLKDFTLNDFVLIWEFSDSTLVNIRANLVIARYSGISAQGIYWRPVTAGSTCTTNDGMEINNANQPTNAFAFGIYFDGFEFDWLIQLILGKQYFSVSWLTDLKALVVISNAYGKVGGNPYIKNKNEKSITYRYPRETEKDDSRGESEEVVNIEDSSDNKLINDLNYYKQLIKNQRNSSQTNVPEPMRLRESMLQPINSDEWIPIVKRRSSFNNSVLTDNEEVLHNIESNLQNLYTDQDHVGHSPEESVQSKEVKGEIKNKGEKPLNYKRDSDNNLQNNRLEIGNEPKEISNTSNVYFPTPVVGDENLEAHVLGDSSASNNARIALNISKDGKQILAETNLEVNNRECKSKDHQAELKQNNNRTDSTVHDMETIRAKRMVDDEPELQFDIPDFESIEIKPGITFGLLWELPKIERKCNGNSLCKWMFKYFSKDFKVIITGYVDPEFNVELSAEFTANIIIVSTEKTSLIFNYFKLILITSKSNPGVELQCKMTFANNDIAAKPLEFVGSLVSDGTNLKLRFSMDNFIIPPQAPYFVLGDMSISIGYTPGVAPFPNLGIGLTLFLGKISVNFDNRNAIRFEGWLEVDPNNPLENWIYVTKNRLTIDAVCKAYELNCTTIDSTIRESGFPKGLQLSYSNKERFIEVTKRNIPIGLEISGEINIYGLSCYANIQVPKNGSIWKFDIEIILPELSWAGGQVVIYKDASAKEGATGLIRIGDGNFELSIVGYAKVITIFGDVRITINMYTIQFQIEGTLRNGLIPVKLVLSARFENMDYFDLQLRGEVKNDFSELLKQYMIQFLQAAADKANEAIASTQRKLDDANQALSSAQSDVRRWRSDVVNWKRDIQAKRDQYATKLARSQSINCSRECPIGCVGGYGPDSCASRYFGYCVPGVSWNSCLLRVTDPICLAKCELEKLGSAALAWFQQKYEEAKSVLATIDQGINDIADSVLDAAHIVVKFAKTLVEATKFTLNVAVKAGQNLLQNADNILELQQLVLVASLDSNFCGTVGFSIKLKLFNKLIHANGSLSLNNILESLYEYITEKSSGSELKGISKTKEIVNNLNGRIKAIEDVKNDLKKAKNNGKQQMRQKQREANKIKNSRRDSILSPEEQSSIDKNGISKLSGNPIYYNEDNVGYLKSRFDSVFFKVPWKTMEDYHPLKTIVNMMQNESNTQSKLLNKRTLDFQPINTPCQKIKRALEVYIDVANGLFTSAKSIHKGYSTLKASTSLNNKYLKDIRRSITQMERRYNMTTQDLDIAYYIYAKLVNGYNELSKKSMAMLKKYDSYALPLLRKKLDKIIRKKTGRTFLQFTEEVNRNAVKGFKRSLGSDSDYTKVSMILHGIKNALLHIVANEDKPLSAFINYVLVMNKDINSMTKYTKNCSH